MSRTQDSPPHARSWRDIPQQLKPRAMSAGGRRRVWRHSLRSVMAVLAIVLIGVVAWGVNEALQDPAPGGAARAADATPVKEIALATDGVLDQAWITRTLALPKAATLMELDLGKLRERLLASGQVHTATVARKFPSTLAVTLAERMPVARIMAQLADGSTHELLVARDGIVYEGAGYDPAIVNSLVWLDGVKLVRSQDRFQPIPGMEPVADLLAKARNEAPHLYATWKSVSLARLASDQELVVNSTVVEQVTFSAAVDFFRQLALLDLLVDTGQPLKDVNLAIGRASDADGSYQVPVTLATPPAPGTANPPAKAPAAAPKAGPTDQPAPFFIPFNPPQKKNPREL